MKILIKRLREEQSLLEQKYLKRIKVPSAVILSEHNYILNPHHPEFAKIRFEVLATEYIDRRLLR